MVSDGPWRDTGEHLDRRVRFDPSPLTLRHAITTKTKRMHATYSIPSDKLKAWFDARLSPEDYQRARKAGFVFWHGSKCFAAKWSPQAEDFVRDMGIADIEADDSPDDVEARVDRFTKYAESAEKSAESSQTYLDERANTERRRKNAINGFKKWNDNDLAPLAVVA